MRWRQESDQPPSGQRIHIPYDSEARFSGKRETTWLGYKVHLTESCDEDAPHLITHVLTTPATTPDFDAPALIQADLAAKERLPATWMPVCWWRVRISIRWRSSVLCRPTTVGKRLPRGRMMSRTLPSTGRRNASSAPKAMSVRNGPIPTTMWGHRFSISALPLKLALSVLCERNAPVLRPARVI